jgi:hypothetical protein
VEEGAETEVHAEGDRSDQPTTDDLDREEERGDGSRQTGTAWRQETES